MSNDNKETRDTSEKFTCRLEIFFSDERLGEFAKLAKQGATVDEDGLIRLKGKDLVEYALMAFSARQLRKGATSEAIVGVKEAPSERRTISDSIPQGLSGLNIASFLQTK